MVINSTAGFQAVYERDGEAEGRRAQERPVHRLRQRSRLQPAGGAGLHRPFQGERSRHQHGAGRRHAADAAGRQLRQPLQSRGPIVSGDPAGAARHAAVAGIARRLLCSDQHRAAGAAVDHRVDRDRHRSEFADALQPAQLRDLLGGADAGRDGRAGGGLPGGRSEEAARRLRPRLSGRLPAICAGGQSARDHLRLRADHHLPGAGGAVRKPARSAGDHDQRSHGDRRRA